MMKQQSRRPSGGQVGQRRQQQFITPLLPPAPSDTRALLTQQRLRQCQHLGLLLSKYVAVWQKKWKFSEKDKSKFLEKIAKQFNNQPPNYLNRCRERQQQLLSGLEQLGYRKVVIDDFQTHWRLVVGLGGESVLETAITLNWLYGFPYIPGSAVKGLARAWAQTEGNVSKDDLLLIFGSEDKYHTTEYQRCGEVLFFDALPTKFPELQVDIMNCHYPKYYGDREPPADWQSPNPVYFLTVAPGTKFIFSLVARNSDALQKAEKWLRSGLQHLGVGAKTAAGYGYLKDFQEA